MRRTSILLAALSGGLLCACSARPAQPAPEAFFAAPIIDMRESKESEGLWRWKQSRYSFEPVMMPSASEPCWFAQIDYIIDSNGNVFNAEVVEIHPNDRFRLDALRMLALHKYVPTDANPERVPVQRTIVMEMKMEGHRCEWE